MTECRPECGACCDPVSSPFNKADVRQLVSHGRIDPTDAFFMLEDLHALSQKEAKRRAPWLRDTRVYGVNPVTREPVYTLTYYECRFFDRETRMCGNYEDRPPMCRHYPTYDLWPNHGVALPPQCSFNADLGRPVALIPKPVTSNST